MGSLLNHRGRFVRTAGVSFIALGFVALAACSSGSAEGPGDATAGAGDEGGAAMRPSMGGHGGAPKPSNTGGSDAMGGDSNPDDHPMSGAPAGGSMAQGGHGGSAPMGECQADADCTSKLPATTPAGCARAQCKDAKCVVVAKDADGDGEPSATCKANDSTKITLGQDCDDTDSAVNPHAKEACDGKDNDCNGSVDDGVPVSSMSCQVGVGACIAMGVLSCADGSFSKCEATPLQPQNVSECDNVDHNCDGQIDKNGCQCVPGQSVHQDRICAGGIDVTCTADGKIPSFDAGPGKVSFCLDGDGDGYASGTCADFCDGSQPAGYIRAGGTQDCNDGSASASPGVGEVCDGIDNNCDGQVDEVGRDCDGQHVGCGAICPDGYYPDPNDAGACLSNSEVQVYHSDPTIGWGSTPGFPGGCGVSKDQNVDIGCGDGLVQSSYTATKISGTGHCEGVWADNDNLNDCSVRIHYGTAWCDAFVCDIDIEARYKVARCQ